MGGKRTKAAPPNNADPVAAAVSAALATQQATFQQVVDAQTKAFQACLQTFVDSMNRRFDAFFSETVTNFTELKASLQFAQIELHEIKNEMHQNINTGKKIAAIEAELKRLDTATDYMENQSRRNNLRMDGVRERPGDTWAETEEAVRRTLQEQLKLPAQQVAAMPIERAHRTGTATEHRDRTIVIKFTSFKDRDTVLRAARTTRPRDIYVNEDYSQRVMARRKELLPEMRAARERGKIAYISFDKLVVKDRHI